MAKIFPRILVYALLIFNFKSNMIDHILMIIPIFTWNQPPMGFDPGIKIKIHLICFISIVSLFAFKISVEICTCQNIGQCFIFI